MARGKHTKQLAQGGRGRGRVRLKGRPCIDRQNSPIDTDRHDETVTEPTIGTQQTNGSDVNTGQSEQPSPAPQCTSSSLHTPLSEVARNRSTDATPQSETNADDTPNTGNDDSGEDGPGSGNTAASEVAEDNSVRGRGAFKANICSVSKDRKRLCPTGAVSRAITNTFQRMWFEEGHLWKTLLPNQVEFYWQEFKKKFHWNEPEALLRAVWVIHASTRYTDNLSKYRLKFERTGMIETHIKQDIWDAWFKKWDTPEYKVKRQKMSSNRRSEKGGPGSGMSRHSCGTKSMLDRHMTSGNSSSRIPDLHKLFLETHTRKGKPSEFIDERSRQFEEKYQKIYASKTSTIGEGVDAQDCMLLSYVEAAEGFDSHSRLYGVGSLGKSIKDGEQGFDGGEMDVGEIDPQAVATIAALKAKVEDMQSEEAVLKSKLMMLESRDAERENQVSHLTALVERFIPGSNGGQGCSNGHE